jgi:hypothetical protein
VVVSPALKFWGSAALVAIAFAALVPVLFPFRALGMDPALERDHVWLLMVFTAGMMMVLFGASGLIAGKRSVGVRDVVEAGGVRQALDRAAEREERRAAGYTSNAAVWTIATGALLLAAYFALWVALRG